MSVRYRLAAVVAAAGAIVAAGLSAASAAQAHPTVTSPYLSLFSKLRTIVSTVPANGDVNPYGIFVVSHTAGLLRAGDVLVSNFNDKANEQGTGSTIVAITPAGHRTVFADISAAALAGRCPGGAGLTTALEVLPGGWVVVGSTPSKNGSAGTSAAGCLIVLDNRGQVAETISGHGINGPWDSTLAVRGRVADLFVTNVLNGTVAGGGKVVRHGTVLRLTLRLRGDGPPKLVAEAEVGSGFAEQTNSSAFVLGPTGIGLGRHGTLYVADTQTNAISAIPDAVTRPGSAGTGTPVTAGGMLSMPLGLTVAPNGDLLTVNGGNGLIVETTPGGAQVASRYLDTSGSPKGAGALFGLALKPHRGGIYYVDDATNTLRLLH
jgi:hypothetical protein